MINVDAVLALGVARDHHLAGRRAEAEEICRKLLEQSPSDDGVLDLLAQMAHAQKRLGPALKLARMAVAAAPAVAGHYNTLGTILGELRRWDECFAAFRHAVRLDARSFEAHRNLGIALAKANRLDDAVAPLEAASRLRPGLSEPLELLLSICYQRLDLKAAESCQRRLLLLRPSDAQLHSSLLYNLHYDPSRAPGQLFGEHLEWARRHERPLLAERANHDNMPDPDRQLRVGYVSPGFHDHPVARFQELILRHHDREAVEVFCYADETNPDAVTERLRRSCARWVDMTRESDERLAQRVRQDRIDVLVDLTGHDRSNRLPAFARRPAPVQVTYNGYIDTTGMVSMGYRITDAWHDPPGLSEHLHTERLVRLPGGNWCYHGDDDAPPAGRPPALEGGGVTFASLNRAAKASSAATALWARVLDAVSGSRLVLVVPGGESNCSARATLCRSGIPPDRLELLPSAPSRTEYLARFQRTDVSLDPFPFNGITTTCDSLWMGVPVVSLEGRTHVSRSGVSLLSAVGLPELIAQTPEEYVEIAVGLASDLPRLAALRAGLRERMRQSPLCDGQRLAREIEAAYRQMWRNWCLGGSH